MYESNEKKEAEFSTLNCMQAGYSASKIRRRQYKRVTIREGARVCESLRINFYTTNETSVCIYLHDMARYNEKLNNSK